MADTGLFNTVYNPDVLTCLANLSNDEVFTPPDIANAMLDMLPQDLFSNPDTKFLDPACKSGVFLREIAKRLIVGLAPQYPDLQDRIDHIMHNQLYGIAITELTAMLSRRSVYCTKYPENQDFSVSVFDKKSAGGNVLFRNIKHTWQDGKCIFCGANEKEYRRSDDLETHAYEFIHTHRPEDILKMKFDVIISNPPYQLSDGGNQSSAVPIYHKFILQAKKLKPRFLTMIVPARWFSGGRGMDSFRDEMLHDDQIRVIHDFQDSSQCFPGVEIKGGVCYFLWASNSHGNCAIYEHSTDEVTMSERPLLEPGMTTLIRSKEAISILYKVRAKGEKPLSEMLNGGRFFGFHTKVNWESNGNGTIQTADGKDTIPVAKAKDVSHNVKVYISHGIAWIDRSAVPKNEEHIDDYKVLIPRAGNPASTILGKPKISEPGSCSSNTYVVALLKNGTAETAENMISYLQTKFLRFLVSLMTSTQDIPPKAYSFVPQQDYSHAWCDSDLYQKYDLTDNEIAFIESSIPQMSVVGGDD